ncbi:MAG: dTMP kinase [Gammaproteobacteria bacterium]|nr:dTMP kinase [Gammaproteobacteria bacterium]MYF02611.1 dTMP kinase [Gammaproteobacteria bacterium]MYI76947.1 dTMP kinase [Gammaproteobacteria bacterium]
MKQGKFITLEGVDGVGKSTVVPNIEQVLQSHSIPYFVTREPGGTPLAEGIRKLLLSEWEENVTAEAELFLMFAARAQHVTEVIKPRIEVGTWVICERFTDASFAYQGGGRNLTLSLVAHLAEAVHAEYWPDLTVYLDLDVGTALQRRAHRTQDRIEKETIDFFENARTTYLKLAETESRIVKIDASVPLTELTRTVSMVVQNFVSQSS